MPWARLGAPLGAPSVKVEAVQRRDSWLPIDNHLVQDETHR